jgi:hypothetical protein
MRHAVEALSMTGQNVNAVGCRVSCVRRAKSREECRHLIGHSVDMHFTDLADEVASCPASEPLAPAIEEQNDPPRVDDKDRQLGLAEPLGKTTARSGSPRHAMSSDGEGVEALADTISRNRGQRVS